MSSMFHGWRPFDSGLLKLPSECVPGGEPDALLKKRDEQLRWMRERGVRYLGNPMVRPDRRAPGSPIARARRNRDLKTMLAEQLGGPIVPGLVSNG